MRESHVHDVLVRLHAYRLGVRKQKRAYDERRSQNPDAQGAGKPAKERKPAFRTQDTQNMYEYTCTSVGREAHERAVDTKRLFTQQATMPLSALLDSVCSPNERVYVYPNDSRFLSRLCLQSFTPGEIEDSPEPPH